VLPQLTPETDLGAAAVAAYAARDGVPAETAIERLGPPLTADQVGKAVVDLACDPSLDHPAYLLNAAGLAAAS
jgi:hypothetical protein